MADTFHKHIDPGTLTTTQMLRLVYDMFHDDNDFHLNALKTTFVNDNGAVDAFGRLRVSDPVTLFDTQQQYDGVPLLWEENTEEAVRSAFTHNSTRASTTLTSGGQSGDYAIRQSREYIRYQPGKSQLIFVTFTMGSAGTNAVQRVGYFDANDGIFLEQSTSGVYFVRRTSTSGTPSDASKVEQASWNIDNFDGTGKSGVTLDISMSQILVIDLEWLGVGRVRVGFVVDGMIHYAHQFTHANEGTGVYMKTPNLPVRYEVRNVDNGSSVTLESICSSVMSEGGFQKDKGYPVTASNGVTMRNATVAGVPIISIRPLATFKGQVNRGTTILEGINIYADQFPIHWKLLWNVTSLGGATSWNDVSTNYSINEVDVASSSWVGGTTVLSGYVSSGKGDNAEVKQEVQSRLPINLDANGGSPTILTLVVYGIGGTASVGVALNWKEYR